MIREVDIPILDAFLQRELLDYRWKNDEGREDRKKETFYRWREAILKHEDCKGNYIFIVSMTNLGQTDRSLQLSANDWDGKAGDIFVHLGTTPRDPVCIQRQSFDPIEDMTKFKQEG